VFGNQAFSDATIISTTLTRKLIKVKIIAEEQEEMEAYLEGFKKAHKISC
jgi:hypothetical protein